MNDVKDILRQDLDDINKMLAIIAQRIDKYKLDDAATLHYSKRKCGYQYYLRREGGSREYIRKTNMDIAYLIAQREYDLRVKAELVKQKKSIEGILKNYDVGAIANIYAKTCDAKRELISPIIQPDESFVAEWQKEHKGGLNPYPSQGKYMTNNGEMVRSKSEKIIADMLDKYGVPYTYEPVIVLKNGKKAYPDFAVLNIRTRKTMYWEHLGMITDGEYASANWDKIKKYDKSGIKMWEKLIVSMESDVEPLDVSEIKEKIEEYLI